MLRLITDGRITPEEAVRAYHGVLQAKGITPKLSLDQDLQLTDQAMSYSGSRTTVSVPPSSPSPVPIAGRSTFPSHGETQKTATRNQPPPESWPRHPNGAPDFAAMTPVQRGAYDQARLKRRFG
jgi:hypothetical protein